jgi:hypothetical protein
MVLFCYGSLQKDTGPANVARLRAEIPGLFQLAKLVRNKPPKGIAAPKPPNSDPGREAYVYDFVGMLGLPLVPTPTVRRDAKAAFLPTHVLKDPQLSDKLGAMLKTNTPVLITDGLAESLRESVLGHRHLTILKVDGNPKSLLELSRKDLAPIRNRLLAPFGLRFDAPNKVALYLIGDHCVVIENFNDEAITAVLEFSLPIEARRALTLPTDADVRFTNASGRVTFQAIAPRTLVALTY